MAARRWGIRLEFTRCMIVGAVFLMAGCSTPAGAPSTSSNPSVVLASHELWANYTLKLTEVRYDNPANAGFDQIGCILVKPTEPLSLHIQRGDFHVSWVAQDPIADQLKAYVFTYPGSFLAESSAHISPLVYTFGQLTNLTNDGRFLFGAKLPDQGTLYDQTIDARLHLFFVGGGEVHSEVAAC